MSVTVEGEPCLPDDNSEETLYITEHYYGYCKQTEWDNIGVPCRTPALERMACNGQQIELDCDVAGIYGHDFRPHSLSGPLQLPRLFWQMAPPFQFDREVA